MLKYAESLILVEFEDGEVVADASHHKRKIAMRNIGDKVIHLFCETMLAAHMLESSTAWEIRSQPLYAGSNVCMVEILATQPSSSYLGDGSRPLI